VPHLPQEPEVLSTLISFRADVHARARSGISALMRPGMAIASGFGMFVMAEYHHPVWQTQTNNPFPLIQS
jgi:hypothetical protein